MRKGNYYLTQYMYIRNLLSLFILLITLLFLFSCDIINPTEDIPSYIKIDTFLVDINSENQGSAHHNLSEVFITIEGNKFGMFELPTLVPVLRTGVTNIILHPGYKYNDQLLVRVPHPFFKPYIIDTILTEGDILFLKPEIKYQDACTFLWVEDFENIGFNMNTEISDTTIFICSENVLEGNYAGVIYLDNVNTSFEGLSPAMKIPVSLTPILIEFFYRNNYSFEVGILTNISSYEYIGHLYPRDNWDKISIDFYNLLQKYQGAREFKIVFRALYTGDTEVMPVIYLDNIKVINN